MVMQLADIEGRQIKALLDITADFELNGGDRDFEIEVSISDYDERMSSGGRVFIADTEIGGIIGELRTDTSTDTLYWSGYTWRGLLFMKVITPPEGQDYYTVSGELNDILRMLIEPQFSGVFVVPEIDTGVVINNWKFDRFCTLLNGISKMLKSVGYRLQIRYEQGRPGGTGYVEVLAVPVVDYSEQIELSQDSLLNFVMTEKKNGVNHLIIGGKGDLQERNIIHLYVQEDGSIGKTQYYTGIKEIAKFYENTSTDTEDVEGKGREQLEKLMDYKKMTMDVESLGLDVAIGDIIGGRDYITGRYMKKPLENIVIKITGETVEKDYTLEGVE